MRTSERRSFSPGFSYVAPSLQEWLETDGLGGFCSTTTAGINTRRYHGWLFLAAKESGERFLALSKIHDSAGTPAGEFDLSTSYYPGGRHPQGVTNLWFFRKDPFPAFTFNLAGRFLTREIFMEKGSPGVFCRYLPEARPGGGSIRLSARPMCNYRSYHHTSKAHSWEPRVFGYSGGVVIEGHPACRQLLLLFHDASFGADPKWYYNMIYPRESDRGLDDTEDHFSPGTFTLEISPEAPGYFWAGPMPAGAGSIEDLARDLPRRYEESRQREVRRRAALMDGPATRSGRLWSLPGRLALAGDQFVVERDSGASIIAGYHWFGEWGRDSFIAMPGLLLCRGRFGEAREVFVRFCDAMKDGLIPNAFTDGPGAVYNSVDASLWMVNALRKYEAYSGDSRFPLSLLPRLQEMVKSYMSGTLYGIEARGDGLLLAGRPDTQVTWMDACSGGEPVTPRHGMPVEVNALWVSALDAVARWTASTASVARWTASTASVARWTAASPFGDASSYRRLASSALAAFRRTFVWPGVGLYDRVDAAGPGKEIRPNQVIAASLPAVALPIGTLRDIWSTAVSVLLTPRGLRTLDPAAPGYRGTYKGNPAERDASYHQGTAWPWLVGPLFDLSAKLDRAFGYEAGRGPFGGLVLNRALPGVVYIDRNPCMGSIFEVASGDWPYEPGGAIAQAWRVGEAQRILDVTLFGRRGGRR
jgi:predicted glycogen debranching enzyme